MRIRIRHKYWNLRYVTNFKDYGECEGPDIPNKTIRIRAGLSPQRELQTLVHELLHAGLWDVSEETVDFASEDIAGKLSQMGWELHKDLRNRRASRSACSQLAFDLRSLLRSRIWSIDGAVLDLLASDMAVVFYRLGWRISPSVGDPHHSPLRGG